MASNAKTPAQYRDVYVYDRWKEFGIEKIPVKILNLEEAKALPKNVHRLIRGYAWADEEVARRYKSLPYARHSTSLKKAQEKVRQEITTIKNRLHQELEHLEKIEKNI